MDQGLPVYVLADEFAMSSSVALAICDQAGIEAESGATVLSAGDTERFRVTARQGAAGTSAPPPAAGPSWAVPGPASPAPGPAAPPSNAGPAWAVPASGAPADPAAPAGAGWSVPSGPNGSADPTGPSIGSSWGASPMGTAPPGPSGPGGPAHPNPGPWPTATGPGASTGTPPSTIDPELWARLQRGRAAANAAMMRGLGLIALGVMITLGTFIVAPGGFFIVSFGPVIAGFSQIGKANSYRSEVARVERALRHYA